MNKFIAAVLMATSALTGCSKMLNVGESEYACKGMPNGVTCMSAKDVYTATEGENYKTQLKMEQEAAAGHSSGKPGAAPETRVLYAEGADNAPMPMRARNPIPIRTQAVVMRIAIDPWEDDNGDLIVPGYIYTEIEPRRWEIGTRQATASPTLRPLNIVKSNLAGADNNSATRNSAANTGTR
ncbi:type IV conjugative transfer system lipoprotein TraV [Pseudomonas nitroreducens]|uniref:Type IV conjugative transfer system lipoprotein TraV n=1 Tax=Pseudomonas nitroreducens TaxID=46680 RepID=A0ABS0KMV5_PSENT|nr:type IV conjugative transfer system lipoprotein TraV [Pseudomonas nitroreducens]MBG6289438.1 type IV conjugative transfer system lipoprotein TraV [Pseudomonas nitroreducens]MDG9857310.1 type IV conjugative transfer system lipoprotein TraV [Pseudomonas nitroreducens]MDH1076596.1 type IV conjugative transfer system lipoprotein TraV [Pseudomonas nitroreducens]